MTDSINSLTSTAATSTLSSTSGVSTSAASTEGLSSDFETFLKMLTAQARYQDPLEPIDSTEYAAQLAQFSMVEQQVQTNDMLTVLTSQIGSSNMASLASWVGMEVRANMPVHFDGSPISIVPGIAPTADSAQLVVKNASGQEVQRQTIDLLGETMNWAGVDETGAPFPSGLYSFSVESFKDTEQLSSVQTEVYGQIVEAQIENGSAMLIFEGGASVAVSDVTALRNQV